MDRLKRYRKTIDNIDRKIVKFFARRIEIVKQIGSYKKIKKLPVSNRKREAAVLKNVGKTAKKHKTDERFVNEIFKAVILESKKLEK